MPHATRTVGSVEVAVLCDAIVTGGDTPQDSFPDVAAAAWGPSLERFPDTLAGNGQWRLHVHCHLVRTGDTTILVDAGVGPDSAPAYSWSGVDGRLLDDLHDADVSPADIDVVAISHVHDDHLGWTLTPQLEPVFPNARYVLQQADWDSIHNADPEDMEVVARTLDPLQRSGVLDLIEGDHRLHTAVRLRHEPGHTPGHQVTFVEADGETLLLSADVVNHPVQLQDPTWCGATDGDFDVASVTRARVLAESSDAGWLVSTAHLADPFGRFVRRGRAWDWAPEA